MKLARFTISICLVGILSCSDTFDEVSPESVEQKLAESANHTAVSWWYAGQDDDFYYIVEKWPMEKMRYKVRKDNMRIDLNVPIGAPPNKEEDWINLKATSIQFR